VLISRYLHLLAQQARGTLGRFLVEWVVLTIVRIEFRQLSLSIHLGESAATTNKFCMGLFKNYTAIEDTKSDVISKEGAANAGKYKYKTKLDWHILLHVLNLSSRYLTE
jgi:hypothetical protein